MIIKAALASAILLSSCSIALADSTVGTILAFDRVAKIIVLKDKTVWTLEGSEASAPDGLKAGDKVEIIYETAGEDGLTKIDAIKMAAQ
jgi:hypothetical protein